MVVFVLLLAVLGANTQCAADCLMPQSPPPCHHHSQSKICNHVQLAADAQATCPPATEASAPTGITFQAIAPEIPSPGGARLFFTILRI